MGNLSRVFFVVLLAGCVGLSLAADTGAKPEEKTAIPEKPGASVDLPKPPPFQLPLFDGNQRTHQPPGVRPAAPTQPDARLLFDMTVACWPAPSWFRGELQLQGRVSQKRTDTAQAVFDPNSGTFQSNAAGTGQEKFVGIVASLPLYSALELDKERGRESQRRDGAAQAVGALGSAIGEMEVTIHQAKLYRAIEKRAQERVAVGVADIAEQLIAIQKLSELEGKLYTLRAAITKARLQLVGMCSEEKADWVDDYIGQFTKGMGL